MGSLSFEVDGEWFPVAGDAVDGESPMERDQREAHLREAREREAERFRCPTCGLAGALARGGDRYHGPGICDQRRAFEAEALEWYQSQQGGAA